MINSLKKVSDFIWEIPLGANPLMRVPCLIFASEEILQQLFTDKSIFQLINVSSLPGIQGKALVMPDAHEGYGFPIGGVAAIDSESGFISPGGIGYDINCGVRILRTNFTRKSISSNIEKISKALFRAVPSGVGQKGFHKLDFKEIDQVLNNGLNWAFKRGFATINDLENVESKGHLSYADASFVSIEAKNRGLEQLGTMGAGNHFVEIDYVESIYDVEIAKDFKISEGQVLIQIHTGSRGLGHQVATDYIKIMLQNLSRFGISLPDKELACAPLNSDIGSQYFAAMCSAANFAWVNRQMITHQIREAFWDIFHSDENISILYDVSHNIAKLEDHKFDGIYKKVLVHRKGATRAFPPNHPDLPQQYQKSGQPVLIPGSMGTASYILAGTDESMDLSFGSTCHGAGRVMSRTKARKHVSGEELLNRLNRKGISVQSGSMKGLAEESPEAYKDIELVVEVVSNAGIARKVARLKPIGVIKG